MTLRDVRDAAMQLGPRDRAELAARLLESLDELSPDDKTTVLRARKIQRFLSQPFSVAQVFTGREGKQVPVAETVRGFKEILDGKHDKAPEGNFYMKGGIDEVKPD